MAWHQKLSYCTVSNIADQKKQHHDSTQLASLFNSIQPQTPHILHNGLVAIFRGDQGTLAARLCASPHRTPDLDQESAYTLSTMLTETATTGAHRPRHWFLPSRRPLRLPSPDHLPWLHPQQPQAQPHQVRTRKRNIKTTTDKTLTHWTGCSLPSPSRCNQLDVK
jgi:hypothetical protein